MRWLFVHQNFPAQFRHVVRALCENPEHEVVAVAAASNLGHTPMLHPRLRVVLHDAQPPSQNSQSHTHRYLRDYDNHIRRGQAVVKALLPWCQQHRFIPDVVVAHPAWGESLFLKDLFPHARHIHYFEYFYQAYGGDVGFDPEFPATLDDHARVRVKNSTQLQSLVACDAGISPTHWQRSRYPSEWQTKIQVVHEGVDTRTVEPNPQAWVSVNGQRFNAGDEVVTYVARNIEPYRGFHSLMRALPHLQARRPQARVIIVGGNEVSYGRPLPAGQTYRQRYAAEVQDRVDWDRVHFVGKLSYSNYLRVLQVSAAHIYLTYPFVLSWSMLEAMAAGCVVVGSDTAPVREVVEHGLNGYLVPFFDPEAIAEQVAKVLANPADQRGLRRAARQTIVQGYDLHSVCLPQWLAALESALKGH